MEITANSNYFPAPTQYSPFIPYGVPSYANIIANPQMISASNHILRDVINTNYAQQQINKKRSRQLYDYSSHQLCTIKPNSTASVLNIPTKKPKVMCINQIQLNHKPNVVAKTEYSAPAQAKVLKLHNEAHEQLLNQKINLDPKLKQERSRRVQEQNQLIKSRKLSLVLDLDLTLLNSVPFSEMDSIKSEIDQQAMMMKTQDLYRIPHMKIWTKLRPGVRQFLDKASQLYELHICTMGSRAYANAMVKLLDPTGKLFGGRIIAKGADSSNDGNITDPAEIVETKDLEGILGLESAVIIVDDTPQVWPYHKHNLVQIEKYIYFPSTRKELNLAGPSLLDIGHDENVHNGTLASILKVLVDVHYDFFINNNNRNQNVQQQQHEPNLNEMINDKDARYLLASEKKKVLAGCKIVFSRVFPQGETQPHSHPLWTKAQEFGAQCSTVIDDSVTHVVATSRGTDKAIWALQNGRACVSPAWIEASTFLYKHLKEEDFPVLK